MPILNTTRNTVICEQSRSADSFLARTRGLMGRKQLEQGHGLMLIPCNSIHTCFMRFSIDVIFVKKDVILGLVEAIPPWRLSPIYWNATFAIELASGTIARSRSSKGDQIRIV